MVSLPHIQTRKRFDMTIFRRLPSGDNSKTTSSHLIQSLHLPSPGIHIQFTTRTTVSTIRYNAINATPITPIPIYYFNNASLSTTSLVNLIKMVHLCGVSSSPVVCAVTLCVKNMVESKTASIIPAKNAPQFNCDILGGTEMNFVIIGALS
jgi:hypothetical protein